MNINDPLREWLQDAWTPPCQCDHCMSVAYNDKSTPIERMMENALDFVRHTYYDDDRWGVHREWPVLAYVADFAIVAPTFCIVIECDGHDFHERTKEQAAHDRKRDRAMTEAGITVLRYTGSEIWRNPFACAYQAVSLALSLQVRADDEARAK